MPTEQQYREAAARFRLFAQQYLDEAGALPPHPAAEFISSRPVVALVDDEFASVARSFHAASRALGALAARCEQRAEECRDERRRRWARSHAVAWGRAHD